MNDKHFKAVPPYFNYCNCVFVAFPCRPLSAEVQNMLSSQLTFNNPAQQIQDEGLFTIWLKFLLYSLCFLSLCLKLKGNVKFIILVSESRILEIIEVSKREAFLSSSPHYTMDFGMFYFFCVCSIKYEKWTEGCYGILWSSNSFISMVIIISSADHNYNNHS